MTNIHTEVRFSIVPEWVIDAEITDRAVRVYALLARYADSETLQAFPSRETLAKRAGCHWRSIDRAIDELVKLGAITKTHRRNGDSYQSNVYTLRRVLTQLSPPTDTAVQGVLTGESVGTDTAGNLTITTELEPIELEPLKSKKRNHKLPEDWVPSQKLLDLFATKWPDLDADYEVEQFCTYWWANGGVKSNWDMAFRNWMNRNQKGFKSKVGRSDSERLRAEALAEMEREENE